MSEYLYRNEHLTGMEVVERLIEEKRLSSAARDMDVDEVLDQMAETEVLSHSEMEDAHMFPRKVQP